MKARSSWIIVSDFAENNVLKNREINWSTCEGPKEPKKLYTILNIFVYFSFIRIAHADSNRDEVGDPVHGH